MHGRYRRCCLRFYVFSGPVDRREKKKRQRKYIYILSPLLRHQRVFPTPTQARSRPRTYFCKQSSRYARIRIYMPIHVQQHHCSTRAPPQENTPGSPAHTPDSAPEPSTQPSKGAEPCCARTYERTDGVDVDVVDRVALWCPLSVNPWTAGLAVRAGHNTPTARRANDQRETTTTTAGHGRVGGGGARGGRPAWRCCGVRPAMAGPAGVGRVVVNMFACLEAAHAACPLFLLLPFFLYPPMAAPP